MSEKYFNFLSPYTSFHDILLISPYPTHFPFQGFTRV